ncbi:MAG: hypothetical protein F4Y03_12610 [Alphaproteobacteria bacterium]|nr:hypothetical protein [Alphaproteobacteria bacterium]
MRTHHLVLLLLGLRRVCSPHDTDKRSAARDELIEPLEAKVCRRNILALGSAVFLAGAADLDPRDLNIFGMKPSDDWGIIIFGSAAILAHIYWYVLRYCHVKNGGRIYLVCDEDGGMTGHRKVEWCHDTIAVRSADRISNLAALVLTGLSWVVIVGLWMTG